MPPTVSGGGSAGLKVAPIINLFVVVVTVILFCGALGMIIFYYSAMDSQTRLSKEVCTIRTLMLRSGDAYREMPDLEVLDHAKQLSDELTKTNGINGVLEQKTRHFLQKVKEGWIPFEGHLYFFTSEQGFYSEAEKDCEKRSAILAYVTSADEETFLEEMVYRKRVPHWFGLRRVRRKWFWITGKPADAPLVFWNTGRPGPNTDIHKTCGEIISSQTRQKSWQDAYCNTVKNWICKMAPEPIYEM
ncbi:C-type lectin domain family 4 member E-like isoform X3 [Paroedura picta]|uniref:C-type lectin domain family 4 member E-like isoform X3 n=1 Tax=Paroedura picta TaxID=143630 RepID=UPI00405738B9